MANLTLTTFDWVPEMPRGYVLAFGHPVTPSTTPTFEIAAYVRCKREGFGNDLALSERNPLTSGSLEDRRNGFPSATGVVGGVFFYRRGEAVLILVSCVNNTVLVDIGRACV